MAGREIERGKRRRAKQWCTGGLPYGNSSVGNLRQSYISVASLVSCGENFVCLRLDERWLWDRKMQDGMVGAF